MMASVFKDLRAWETVAGETRGPLPPGLFRVSTNSHICSQCPGELGKEGGKRRISVSSLASWAKAVLGSTAQGPP